mmetsp:Transcript_54473/g.153017  ORF Transcript_54473/g.153017 Transcript_54473/m.153017 type:complete len:228 (+) Transcript_54473:431-1114(+)
MVMVHRLRRSADSRRSAVAAHVATSGDRPGRQHLLGHRGAELPCRLFPVRRPRPGVLLVACAPNTNDRRGRSCPRWHGLRLARGQRVVVLATAPLPLPIALHPLQEFEVVLVLRADQLVHIDVFLDAQLVESRLQHLVVRDELVVGLRHPIHLSHGDGARLASVKDLAIDRTAGALLDLREAYLQQVVYPSDQFCAGHEEGTLHHAHGGGVPAADAPRGHGSARTAP